MPDLIYKLKDFVQYDLYNFFFGIFVGNTHNVAYLLIGVAIIILIILMINIKKKGKIKKECDLYTECFEKYFRSTYDIKETLVEMQSEIPVKSPLYKAIQKSVYHLDNSIMRDYDTALNYIYMVYESEDIKQMHTMCVNMLKAKDIKKSNQ